MVPDGATLECFQKSRESLEYISDILVEAGLSLSDLIILNPSLRPIEKMGRVVSLIWRFDKRGNICRPSLSAFPGSGGQLGQNPTFAQPKGPNLFLFDAGYCTYRINMSQGRVEGTQIVNDGRCLNGNLYPLLDKGT